MYLEWYLKEQAAGEKTLEETVVELLAEKGFHITTAESCTGGMALWSMLPEHRRY
jgi:nicotinamide-nucleotide amidase